MKFIQSILLFVLSLNGMPAGAQNAVPQSIMQKI